MCALFCVSFNQCVRLDSWMCFSRGDIHRSFFFHRSVHIYPRILLPSSWISPSWMTIKWFRYVALMNIAVNSKHVFVGEGLSRVSVWVWRRWNDDEQSWKKEMKSKNKKTHRSKKWVQERKNESKNHPLKRQTRLCIHTNKTKTNWYHWGSLHIPTLFSLILKWKRDSELQACKNLFIRRCEFRRVKTINTAVLLNAVSNLFI